MAYAPKDMQFGIPFSYLCKSNGTAFLIQAFEGLDHQCKSQESRLLPLKWDSSSV
jgi:hypothetical protein